jgi:hypothetical protein
MKTYATIVVLVLVGIIADAATVTFNLTDFLGTVQTLQRKTALVEPLSTVRQNGSNLVLSERRQFSTGTNGIFIATNMNEGTYQVRVYGGSYTSVFRVNIPSTNGALVASDYLTSISSTALDTEEGQTLDLE